MHAACAIVQARREDRGADIRMLLAQQGRQRRLQPWERWLRAGESLRGLFAPAGSQRSQRAFDRARQIRTFLSARSQKEGTLRLFGRDDSKTTTIHSSYIDSDSRPFIISVIQKIASVRAEKTVA
jgi:hypothetical protein